jgi:predicted  nucleic acid-binding Zn-ribbon protein
MDLLIPCHCHKCGVIGESILSWASPHIKQSCPECGAYQKFYDKARIPDVREIKIKIFGAVNQDLEKINSLKLEFSFVEGLKGLDAKLQYYKLYKAAIKP